MVGLVRGWLVGVALLLGSTELGGWFSLQAAEKASAKPNPVELRRIVQDQQRPPFVRAQAALQLGELADRDSVPVLRQMLQDPEKECRYAAAFALAMLADPECLPVFREAIRDGGFREKAAEKALGRAGKEAMSLLAIAVKDSSPDLRLLAVAASAQVGEAALPILATALEDQDHRVRQKAVEVLAVIGKSALPLLAKALQDKDPEVRCKTLEVLPQLGESAVPLLVQAMSKDRDHRTIRTAVQGLLQLGQPGQTALLKALPECSSPARVVAVLAESGPTAVPILREAMKIPDPEIRRSAIRALGHLQAKEALPDLAEALKDPDAKWAAADALCQIDDPKVIPFLEEAIKDRSVYFDLRKMMVERLARFGQAGIPGLLQALHAEEPVVHRAAVRGLAQLGAPGRTALYKVLQSPEPLLRAGAAYALAALRDKSAIPALRETMKDPVRSVRQAAARALKNLDDEGEKVLQEATKDPNWRVRTIAQEALKERWNIPPLAAEPEEFIEKPPELKPLPEDAPPAETMPPPEPPSEKPPAQEPP